MRSNKRRSSASYNQGPKTWPALIIGLLIGGLIMFLLSLQDWGSSVEKDAPKSTAQNEVAKEKKESTESSKLPHFEFYTLLPEMGTATSKPTPPLQEQTQTEITIPKKAIAPQQQPKPQPRAPAEPSPMPKPKPAEPSPSKPAPSKAYVLQAGSFRSYTQADKRKAVLALMGIEATIQTVAIDNSKTWHRVRIGPNTDLAKLQKIQQQLRNNHIECQLFKVKS